MALKVCAIPGCPRLQRESKCPEHRREAERARGSSTARGYGSQHQRLAADYQRRMNKGERFTCWRCGKPVGPERHTWQLGHDDHDRRIYRGPECIPCNAAVAGR